MHGEADEKTIMIRLGGVIACAIVGLGVLLGLWGLYGTLNPRPNGGYEVTRFLAKTGAIIAFVGLGLLLIVRRSR